LVQVTEQIKPFFHDVVTGAHKMKTITLQLDEHDEGAILDAVNDAAIALRTNPMSGVVMAEAKFLESGISEERARGESDCEFAGLVH
jgi:hypothetical protein